MSESFPISLKQESTSLGPHIKETIEVQTQGKLMMLWRSQFMPTKLRPWRLCRLKHEAHLAPCICLLKVNGNNPNLSIKRYSIVTSIMMSTFAIWTSLFNKLIRIEIGEQECQILTTPNFLKNIYVFKKVRFLVWWYYLD